MCVYVFSLNWSINAYCWVILAESVSRSILQENVAMMMPKGMETAGENGRAVGGASEERFNCGGGGGRLVASWEHCL